MFDKLITWLAIQPLPFSIIILVLILLILMVMNIDKIKFLFPTFIKKERSCKDCVMIIRNMIIKKEREIYKKENDIMENRMNFVTQKLLELQSYMLLTYTTELKNRREDMDNNSINETIQYRTYYGILKDALMLAKDEIRRAFKNNGFYDTDDLEFSKYLRDEIEVIKSFISQHILNMYPNSGMIIPYDEITNLKNNVEDKIIDVVSEIFKNARQTFKDNQKDIEVIDETSSLELNKFIENIS